MDICSNIFPMATKNIMDKAEYKILVVDYGGGIF